jgi:hypothetical protein
MLPTGESLPFRRVFSAVPAACIATLLSCAVISPASAQTIAEYSRSQRAVIEADIVRNNAKAFEGVLPKAEDGSLQLPPVKKGPPLPDVRPVPGSTAPLPVEEPRMVVSGVFVSRLRTVAEVIVEGVPYMLSTGQEVPGTPYRVQSVSSERVVLVGLARSRQPAKAPMQVFNLPVTPPAAGAAR